MALERFSQRVVDEAQAVCRDESLTAHERYLKLYGLIDDQNEEMASAFDDVRRSTADLQLRLIRRHGLLTEEETSQFSAELQRVTSIVL